MPGACHGFVSRLINQFQMFGQKIILDVTKISKEFWISFMFDEKLHRRAAANIDFRCGENVGKHFCSHLLLFQKACISESVRDKELFLKKMLVHPRP